MKRVVKDEGLYILDMKDILQARKEKLICRKFYMLIWIDKSQSFVSYTIVTNP